MRRLLTLAAVLAMTGCVAVPGGTAYNPNPLPPPLRAEMIPKAPVSDQMLIWQPGHWDWDEQAYVWRHGRYVPIAGHGTQWLYGYWSNTGGTWAWIPAHWV